MRGATNIRSSAGRRTRAAVPKQYRQHELFMQVTCLEMEKARRGVERTAAANRVSDIDTRLAAIDQERESLLTQLAELGALSTAPHCSPSPPLRPATMGGFRIQY